MAVKKATLVAQTPERLEPSIHRCGSRQLQVDMEHEDEHMLIHIAKNNRASLDLRELTFGHLTVDLLIGKLRVKLAIAN